MNFVIILLPLIYLLRFGASFTTQLETLRALQTSPVTAPSVSAKASSSTNVIEQEVMNYESQEVQVEGELLPMQPEERVHSIRSPFLQMNDDALRDTDTDTQYKNAFIILNSPIEINSFPNGNEKSQSSSCSINPIFDTLWNISSYRVCADGGANRLYDATETSRAKEQSTSTSNINMNANTSQYIPNLIKGDLDSIHQDVVGYYEQNGCQIIQDFDQNTNDLDKALQEVHGWRSEIISELDNTEEGRGNGRAKHNANSNGIVVQVYIYGAFGGRFDQEMASIQALYKWADVFDYRIFLYNHETCSWLLKPMEILDEHEKVINHGNDITSANVNQRLRNEISVPFYGEKRRQENINLKEGVSRCARESNSVVVGEGPTCGLIPIGCKVNRVKTKGLKWDLDGSSGSTLEFGGLVSSSNRAMEDVITVYTSDPIVFTAEIIFKNN